MFSDMCRIAQGGKNLLASYRISFLYLLKAITCGKGPNPKSLHRFSFRLGRVCQI
jgi:hypothetical protein